MVRRGIHTHDDKDMDMDLYLRMTPSKQLVKRRWEKSIW